MPQRKQKHLTQNKLDMDYVQVFMEDYKKRSSELEQRAKLLDERERSLYEREQKMWKWNDEIIQRERQSWQTAQGGQGGRGRQNRSYHRPDYSTNRKRSYSPVNQAHNSYRPQSPYRPHSPQRPQSPYRPQSLYRPHSPQRSYRPSTPPYRPSSPVHEPYTPTMKEQDISAALNAVKNL